MNKQIFLKKWLTPFFLIFIMFLGVLISSKNVLAENKNVDVNITNLTITDTEGNIPSGGHFASAFFKLNIDWDASKYGNELREGDYFELQLPDKFKFPESSADCDFNLFTKGGDVIARAHVTPTFPGGGRVRVTFTDYVNNKYDIKGQLYLMANWNHVSYPIVQEGEHDIVIGSFHKHVVIKPGSPSPPSSTIFTKYSGQTLSPEGHARWVMEINTKLANLTNVVLKDRLSVEPPGSMDGIMYIADKFILYDLVMENGNWQRKNARNVSDQVVLSPDKRSFSYNLGNVNGKAYALTYRTTYRDGLKLINNAELTSSSTTKIVTSHFVQTKSGGTGQGKNYQRIDIEVRKVWKDKNNYDGKRPRSIRVKLFADGKDTGKSLILSAANNWRGKFTNLQKNTMSGKLIKYTVKESPSASGYTTSINGNAEVGFIITNVRKPYKPPKPNPPPKTPNKPASTTPQTGDKRNLSIYLFMLLASGALLLANAARKRHIK